VCLRLRLAPASSTVCVCGGGGFRMLLADEAPNCCIQEWLQLWQVAGWLHAAPAEPQAPCSACSQVPSAEAVAAPADSMDLLASPSLCLLWHQVQCRAAWQHHGLCCATVLPTEPCAVVCSRCSAGSCRGTSWPAAACSAACSVWVRHWCPVAGLHRGPIWSFSRVHAITHVLLIISCSQAGQWRGAGTRSCCWPAS
jgi:hypothetical protein